MAERKKGVERSKRIQEQKGTGVVLDKMGHYGSVIKP